MNERRQLAEAKVIVLGGRAPMEKFLSSYLNSWPMRWQSARLVRLVRGLRAWHGDSAHALREDIELLACSSKDSTRS